MADTARTRPSTAGGATSPDFWEDRWRRAAQEAEGKAATAIGSHVDGEWHHGRQQMHTLGADFVAAPAASAGTLLRCTAFARFAAYAPASGSIVAVPLDSEGTDPFDPDGWHDESTSSPYIILPSAGDYLIHARFAWDTDGTAIASDFVTQAWLYGGPTGTDVLLRDERTYHNLAIVGVTDVLPYHSFVYADHLAAGSRINLRMRQFSGAAHLTYRTDEGRPQLTVLKVG